MFHLLPKRVKDFFAKIETIFHFSLLKMSKLLEIAENIFPQLLKYIESLPKTEMRYYWINECDSNNLSPFERLCFNQRILAIAENET